MEYRSVTQLNERIVDWTTRLPRDLDLIVGVPRSGLLAANLLALHMNLPMTDVEGLIEGRLMRSGSRTNGSGTRDLHDRPRSVLVVDDSICSGSAMRKVRQAISAASLPHRIRYAAVFISREAEEREDADLFAEIVPVPRVFEWNLFHTPLLQSMCVDIDGVLCHDPTDSENDDGDRYMAFLQNAPPLHLPTFEIGWLVTSRLEKYRSHTEAWLSRHGVRYRELIMMQYPDMASRRAARQYTAFKADVYKSTGPRSSSRALPTRRPRWPRPLGKRCSAWRRGRCCGPGPSPALLPLTDRSSIRPWQPSTPECAGPPDWRGVSAGSSDEEEPEGFHPTHSRLLTLLPAVPTRQIARFRAICMTLSPGSGRSSTSGFRGFQIAIFRLPSQLRSAARNRCCARPTPC
jgi:orotate phosphoribosyltransferase